MFIFCIFIVGILTFQNTQEASPHITLSVCDPDESEEEENSITEIKKIIGSKSSISVKSNRVRVSYKYRQLYFLSMKT